MILDEIDPSVKSSDPAIHSGQEPDLTTDMKTRDRSPTEPQQPSKFRHRRGRRKVIKKKMLKDEEGYLGEQCQLAIKASIQNFNSYFTVTKEEPSWESFSEEEPLVQKGITSTPYTASTGRGKKTGGKGPGQGNIRSFFGQK